MSMGKGVVEEIFLSNLSLSLTIRAHKWVKFGLKFLDQGYETNSI